MSKKQRILFLSIFAIVIGIIIAVVLVIQGLNSQNEEDSEKPSQSTETEQGTELTPTGKPIELTPTDKPAEPTLTEEPAEPSPTAEVIREPKYHVGDSVLFGRYEQDGNTENGSEDVEWIVLDVEEQKVLLVSKYALASMPFQNISGETKWETSSIRAWLNGEFLGNAFSETERGHLVSSSIENKDYYLGVTAEGILKANNTGEGLEVVSVHTAGGAATVDQVFLLSVDEANNYFSSAEARSLRFTGAAREQFLRNCVEDAKAYGITDEKMILENVEKWEQEHGVGSCYWWLRNPGMNLSYCSIVDNDGVTYYSQNADNREGGIRPAMWVVFLEDE